MSFQPSGWGGSQPQGEVTIYQDALVLITSQRMQTGGAMYPIRNITAVSGGVYAAPPDYSKALACFAGAGVTIVLGFSAQAAIFLATPVLIVAGLFLAMMASGKPVYTVIVSTSGMQHPAVQTFDQRHRDTILAALQRAVAGG